MRDSKRRSIVHVCKFCGRGFKTGRAWEQHRCSNPKRDSLRKLPIDLLRRVAIGELTQEQAEKLAK